MWEGRGSPRPSLTCARPGRFSNLSKITPVQTNDRGTAVRMAVRVKARQGKISRLPYAIRLEVNRRIFRGQPPAAIVAFLNSQPSVHDCLNRHFGGALVTAENLKGWRVRGRDDVHGITWLAPRRGKKRGRKSKMERLPEPIRTALNLRLRDGHTGSQILAWLNSRPAVRAILETQFAGQKFNQENLSHYRHINYAEWLATEILSNGNG